MKKNKKNLWILGSAAGVVVTGAALLLPTLLPELSRYLRIRRM